jgi:hypothetical protein
LPVDLAAPFIPRRRLGIDRGREKQPDESHRDRSVNHDPLVILNKCLKSFAMRRCIPAKNSPGIMNRANGFSFAVFGVVVHSRGACVFSTTIRIFHRAVTDLAVLDVERPSPRRVRSFSAASLPDPAFAMETQRGTAATAIRIERRA